LLFNQFYCAKSDFVGIRLNLKREKTEALNQREGAEKGYK